MAVKREFIDATEELNKQAGKTFYVFAYENTMLATTRMHDLNETMKEDELILQFGDDAENFKLYYGVVLNPGVLPTELPDTGEFKDCDLILVSFDGYATLKITDGFKRDIAELIEEIEDSIADDHSLSIDDFSVLYGKKLEFVLQIRAAGFNVTLSQGSKLACQTTT